MAIKKFLTAESVTPAHPDKASDIIADGILDTILKDDKYARVACEVFTGMGYVIVGGEITTRTWVDINNLVRKKIKEIGYDKPEYGFNCDTLAVFNTMHEQSPDIAHRHQQHSFYLTCQYLKLVDRSKKKESFTLFKT